MKWIVIGEDKGKIVLASKTEGSSEKGGLLPKGSYLTVEKPDTHTKFILRVDATGQHERFSPSPLVIEMDLSALKQDQECQNIVYAHRVKDVSDRDDGLVDFILPQLMARLSTQEEINQALGNTENGPKVFIATIHASQNQLLKDEQGRLITADLPQDMFFHQLLICGKTGSGKTVATKYLAQYFCEKMEGAVLAINVKDIDLLRMDQPSVVLNKSALLEWRMLDETARGMENCTIYYPASMSMDSSKGINLDICKKISLDVTRIEPESLTGLLQGISDSGVLNFPNIFRYWQEDKIKNKEKKTFTFSDFVRYFNERGESGREFRTMNSRGEVSIITMHRATYDNILRNLDYALVFFDNEDAVCLDETDILVPGKLSVINIAGMKGGQFGSIILRDLLHRIVDAKSTHNSKVKILIIIDEVHQFYNSNSSKEALGDLDTICRTGRSQEIGIIFSSQNPSDIPTGLSSVINTKMFFKTDAGSAKTLGIKISDDELESLGKGFAVASIHDMSALKVLKFPISFAGVFEGGI